PASPPSASDTPKHAPRLVWIVTRAESGFTPSGDDGPCLTILPAGHGLRGGQRLSQFVNFGSFGCPHPHPEPYSGSGASPAGREPFSVRSAAERAGFRVKGHFYTNGLVTISISSAYSHCQWAHAGGVG